MKLTTDNAKKILNLYDKRVLNVIKPLLKQDQQDIKMELDSHIYESMIRHPKEDEVTTLMHALEKLGEPEVFLYDVVAECKLAQAGKSFNPLHIANAIALNIGRGFVKSVLFVIISLLYIMSFGFAALAILKPFFPSKIGLYIYPDSRVFSLGYIDGPHASHEEVLGAWFTPIIFAAAIFIYVIITILLKYIPRKRKISS